MRSLHMWIRRRYSCLQKTVSSHEQPDNPAANVVDAYTFTLIRLQNYGGSFILGTLYNTIQHNTIQYNTIQLNVLVPSLQKHGRLCITVSVNIWDNSYKEKHS